MGLIEKENNVLKEKLKEKNGIIKILMAKIHSLEAPLVKVKPNSPLLTCSCLKNVETQTE